MNRDFKTSETKVLNLLSIQDLKDVYQASFGEETKKKTSEEIIKQLNKIGCTTGIKQRGFTWMPLIIDNKYQ